MYVCMYVYTYVCVYQSIDLSIDLCIYPSIYRSISFVPAASCPRHLLCPPPRSCGRQARWSAFLAPLPPRLCGFNRASRESILRCQCTHTNTHTCVCVCQCVYVCACVCVCVCVCVYTGYVCTFGSTARRARPGGWPHAAPHAALAMSPPGPAHLCQNIYVYYHKTTRAAARDGLSRLLSLSLCLSDTHTFFLSLFHDKRTHARTYTHKHTHTHTHVRTHARTRARTRARAHTHSCQCRGR